MENKKPGPESENVIPFPGNEGRLNQMIDEAQDELTRVLSKEGFLYLQLDQAHERKDEVKIQETEGEIEKIEQEKLILEERLNRLTEQKKKFHS